VLTSDGMAIIANQQMMLDKWREVFEQQTLEQYKVTQATNETLLDISNQLHDLKIILGDIESNTHRAPAWWRRGPFSLRASSR
jgi:hypothetical protein